ncbi:MAG: phosphopantothenoylcysteine decarboxylase, partial [bacterium]
EAAREMGAAVTLITGPTQLMLTDPSINRIDVISAEEMSMACFAEAGSAHMIIMAAAVADYTVKSPSKSKIKKSGKKISLDLEETTDILKEIGKTKRKGQVLVGFALETEHEQIHARAKLKSKNLDYIVLNSLNDKGAGFGSETNKVTIFNKKGITFSGEVKSKREVAEDILKFISGTLPK